MNITNIIGTKYPIIQGAMAWISAGQLAAAVSKAGGLGVIAAGNAPIEWVREQIRFVKSQTDNPFGVNIMLMSDTSDMVAQLVMDEKVPVVTTGAGSPAKYMDDWKKAGIKVIPVVPSAALAKRMARLGVDAVIAEGSEAGGHIGDISTMALTPRVVDAIDIPVISAGGISDGRGMAASFCLGAIGVQMGTRFIVSKECSVHQNYKDLILKAKDTDTVITGRSNGLPVRALKTPLTKSLLQMEREGEDKMKIEIMSVGGLRKAAQEGDHDNGSFMAGQVAGLFTKIKSCEEIILETYEKAKQLVSFID